MKKNMTFHKSIVIATDGRQREKINYGTKTAHRLSLKLKSTFQKHLSKFITIQECVHLNKNLFTEHALYFIILCTAEGHYDCHKVKRPYHYKQPLTYLLTGF